MSQSPPAPARPDGGFLAALLIGWVVLGAAGFGYARMKEIPGWAAFPVLAAFLVEYPFYLVPAFPRVRELFGGRRLPFYLVLSVVLPYLACCFGAVQFDWGSLLRLAALALTLGLWFVVLPRSPLTDIGFLAIIPCVLLGRYFNSVYLPVYPKLKELLFLGHVGLIQMAVMTLLLERRIGEFGYGFLPNRKEWRIGAMHFLYFAPVGLGIAWFLQMMRFGKPVPLWLIPAAFAGFLCTVALSEEFFVWGVLQRSLEDWKCSRATIAIVASSLFGLVHIGFRGFPNWRWVLLAGVLGYFCGRARNQAGSIRAGMVTHSLVFTIWWGFFK